MANFLSKMHFALNIYQQIRKLYESMQVRVLIQFLQNLLRLFAIMFIAFLANFWLTIPAVVIVTAMLLFRHYFLHTSRYVQRLEASGKH